MNLRLTHPKRQLAPVWHVGASVFYSALGQTSTSSRLLACPINQPNRVQLRTFLPAPRQTIRSSVENSKDGLTDAKLVPRVDSGFLHFRRWLLGDEGRCENPI